ncbi:MAG TPA: hypothetical protein VJ804_08715, partial [Acidimicrobiales bacterium]|nr:hypothetical protein [Acidimicrobiales bacterium]
VRSCRVQLREVSIDDVAVDAGYADLFVVLREGDEVPGPTDWEAMVRTDLRQRLPPGRHELRAVTGDDQTVRGEAVLRFSDGHRHLFRGDGHLDGASQVVALDDLP